MPAAQLFASALEAAINQLLSLDPESTQRLQALAGKSIIVSLAELNNDLAFHFTDQVTLRVLIREPKVIEHCDCRITTKLSVLRQLQDTSQLTRLIKADLLQLDGDINIAQDFANLFKQLDIDWEGYLAKYTGDVVAHNLARGAQLVKEKISKAAQRGQTILRDAAIEEKRVAAPGMLVDDFVEAVFDTRGQVDSLERRIEQLENSKK